MVEKSNQFEKYFRESLEKAAESCSIALSDILTERRLGEEGKIDTKILKDVTAALKDLNGLGGNEVPDSGLMVAFSGEASLCGR